MSKIDKLQTEEPLATENLSLRIDRKTMDEIKIYREVFGKKAVASWLRKALRKAIETERKRIKQKT